VNHILVHNIADEALFVTKFMVLMSIINTWSTCAINR